MTIHAEIARCFYRLTAVKGHPASAVLPAIRELLTEDFSSTGPLLKTQGREQYLGLLARTLTAEVNYRFLHQFTERNEVCSVYELTTRSPEGENLTVPMVDWLTVYKGRIHRQRLYYDPRCLAGSFGVW